MTRPRNLESARKEARLQEALAAVRSEQHNVPSAAKEFGVSSRTLYDRVNGVLPRNQAHEAEQILSKAEEKELVRWITRLTITGYPPRHSTLREMAEEVQKRRVKQINDPSMQLVNYPPIGQQWIPRFLIRHPELTSIITRRIDAPRIKDTSPEAMWRWFNELDRVIKEFEIKWENIYNMDESGFSIGEIEATKRVINAKIREQFQAKPGRQEWVTSVECICADGTAISPLIIFRAKCIQRQYVPPNLNPSWTLSFNSKGWTSNKHGIQWLRECFEPNTREKANGEPRLLICDGHDSHITGEYIGHCMDNNIHLMILPPHSSHLTQPLDVGVFGPLKKVLAAKLDPIIRTGIANVQKSEWLAAFEQAHNQVFSKENIQGGFRGTGIYPYNPDKVINRVALPATPPPQNRSITPPPVDTPFNENVITSSPIDMEAVRFANHSINNLIASNTSIPTPARRYLQSVTRTNERLYARNTILEREKKEISDTLTARRTQISGRRRAISGQHLLTTVEVFNKVIEAEAETKKRKAEGGKERRKRGSKATEVSGDGSGDDLDREIEVINDIMDSIDS
jgi:hypothetical protein